MSGIGTYVFFLHIYPPVFSITARSSSLAPSSAASSVVSSSWPALSLYMTTGRLGKCCRSDCSRRGLLHRMEAADGQPPRHKQSRITSMYYAWTRNYDELHETNGAPNAPMYASTIRVATMKSNKERAFPASSLTWASHYAEHAATASWRRLDACYSLLSTTTTLHQLWRRQVKNSRDLGNSISKASFHYVLSVHRCVWYHSCIDITLLIVSVNCAQQGMACITSM